MLVRERMTRTPVTVHPETPVTEALRLMRERKVRRFPVLDSNGRLVGIVSDKDLLHASPSPATTLSMWEIPDLLAKIRIEHVMTRDVVTVADDTPLETAARVMADRKIGGLPVMSGETLVGIITETDLFKSLLEMLGGRRPGIRIAVGVADAKGTLAQVTNAVFAAGGNIVGLGVHELPGGDEWQVMLKVQDVGEEALVAALRPVVREVIDVRTVSPGG
jgi:acetoin utilization protein AcuB